MVEKKNARSECVQACLASVIKQSAQDEIKEEKSIPAVHAQATLEADASLSQPKQRTSPMK